MGRNGLAHPVVQLAFLLSATLAVAAPDAGERPVPTEGIVVEVDRIRGTVLVDHGPIGGLLASARTEFPAEDVGLLEGVKAGDHIGFAVASGMTGHGILTITELHVQPRGLDLGRRFPSPAGFVAALLAATLLVQSVWILRELRRARARDWKLLEEHEDLRRSLGVGLGQLAQGLGAVADRLRSGMTAAQPTSPPGPAAAGRPTADSVDTVPLVVVQRGESETYRQLSERLDPARVRMIWDRRLADRRTGSALTSPERRRRERRQAPPVTWAPWRYLVTERGGRHLTVVE
jgi:hypothetical protein